MWSSRLMFTISVVLLHFIDKTYSEITDIRLIPNTNSTTTNVGTIKLNYNGDYVYVCFRGHGVNPHTWSKREAIVACRQLQFKGGWPVFIDVHLNESLYLYNFDCDGGETALEDCYYASTESCTNSQLAGVHCYNSFEAQIVGGIAPNMGRVEVKYDDVWSTVCYQSKEGDTRKWSFSNVQVVCRELGFPRAVFARRGETDKEIHQSKLYGYKCTEDATETSLADCFPERPIYAAEANASCGTGNNAVAVCAVPGYIGCYERGDMTEETSSTLVLTNMTINTCRKYCRKNNFTYAGLLTGNDCICENNITYVHVTDGLCGEICAGNHDQICGGETTLSVYHVSNGTCVDPFNSTDIYYYGDIIDDFKCDSGMEPYSSRPIQCVMDDNNYSMRWNNTLPQCEFEKKPKPIQEELNTALIIGLCIGVPTCIGVILFCIVVIVFVHKRNLRDYSSVPRPVDMVDQGTQMSIPYRSNSFSLKRTFSFGKKKSRSAVDGNIGEAQAQVPRQTTEGGTNTDENDMNETAINHSESMEHINGDIESEPQPESDEDESLFPTKMSIAFTDDI